MPIPIDSQPAPNKRTLLRDTVFERLRDAILDGTLQPGERLHDEQIEKWLGVSRTPVRDALNELSRSGLVEMAPNRYTRVAVPREEEAIHALQVLGVILGGVVRLATPRMKDKARAAAVTKIALVAKYLRGGDAIGANSAAVQLWTSIANECGNPLLINLCEQTIDGLAFKLRFASISQIVDFSAQAVMFETVGERIAAGDAIGAELAIEELHMLSAEQRTGG